MSLKLIASSWQTSPLPRHFLKFLPSGAWGPGETVGETKMAPYDNGAVVQLTSNESMDSAGTQLGLSVQ